ncbi:hypothetical protein D8674_038147 [Pyrus ussuriensis x Pyrus communis]|uniref:Zinc transport protein ZntB n=1 Tax=Pyrus ussuriensis x Pyrus communis TaxID=2448454 RepID=A0A5N5I4E9_9ROSA|nr:hypothetical protein D8674_038147 [Pyrus ussuriensis x Pyrus communis]
MELHEEEPVTNKEAEEIDREPSEYAHFREPHSYQSHFGGIVRKKAYIFNGSGKGNEFSWYHVELPKEHQKLSQSAQYLIGVLCPPLKLQDILSFNSPDPPSSDFTFRIAARITENLVITVSLGHVPRLGFSPVGQSLLSEIPNVESPSYHRGEQRERKGIVIRVHVLEFLLTMNHSEEDNNLVPKSVSNLVVHIVDTHVDHLQDVVTKLEIELDSVELQMDKGGFALKKQMLDDRRFPKMHLNLQRLLQQVFPHVKERCSSKQWFSSEDIASLKELIGRLRKLKENVGFIANRVTAIQTGLDTWQAEQINRKLYCLYFLSITFLPLSIITGGPWMGQKDPTLKDGFRNVMLLCVAMLLLALLCFNFPVLYTRITVWHRRRVMKRSWSLNRKSFLKKTHGIGVQERRGYLRI